MTPLPWNNAALSTKLVGSGGHVRYGMCVFITAGPITKLFARTREEPGTSTQGAPVFPGPGSSRLGIEPKTPGWLVQDPLDLWRVYFAEPQSPTGPKKRIQGVDCCPRRMSLLRFPWLFPIRNPFELRGLCRRSYFGPRTCGRSINHFSSKCSGFLIRVSPVAL